MAKGVWNSLVAVKDFAVDTYNSKGQNLVQAAENVNSLATLAHAAPEFAAEVVVRGAKQNFVEKIQEHGSVNGAVSAIAGEVIGGTLLGAASDKGLSKLGTVAKVVDKAADVTPDGFNNPVSADDVKYSERLNEHAPVEGTPYQTNTRYHENGDVKQVTTYDQHGDRYKQYDLKDSRGREAHEHTYNYSSTNPRPDGKRTRDHKKIE
jgi:hypothetical protein